MRFGRLFTTALVTTGIVLVTIWLMNRIPFTRNFVQMALS